MGFDLTQIYHIAGTVSFGGANTTIPPVYINSATVITIDKTYLGSTLTDTVTAAQKSAVGCNNTNTTFYIKPSINLYTLFNSVMGRAPVANEYVIFNIAPDVAVVGFTTIGGANNAIAAGTVAPAGIQVGNGWLSTNILNINVSGLVLGAGGAAVDNADGTAGSPGIAGGNIGITVVVSSTGYVNGGGGGGGGGAWYGQWNVRGGPGAPYGKYPAASHLTSSNTFSAYTPATLLAGGSGEIYGNGSSTSITGGAGGNVGAAGVNATQNGPWWTLYNGGAGGVVSSGTVTMTTG